MSGGRAGRRKLRAPASYRLRILVVVANIQMRTLKAERERFHVNALAHGQGKSANGSVNLEKDWPRWSGTGPPNPPTAWIARSRFPLAELVAAPPGRIERPAFRPNKYFNWYGQGESDRLIKTKHRDGPRDAHAMVKARLILDFQHVIRNRGKRAYRSFRPSEFEARGVVKVTTVDNRLWRQAAHSDAAFDPSCRLFLSLSDAPPACRLRRVLTPKARGRYQVRDGGDAATPSTIPTEAVESFAHHLNTLTGIVVAEWPCCHASTEIQPRRFDSPLPPSPLTSKAPGHAVSPACAAPSLALHGHGVAKESQGDKPRCHILASPLPLCTHDGRKPPTLAAHGKPPLGAGLGMHGWATASGMP
ncbi:hypothetical protein FNV43_RR20892 [Rhamnella rubrinervis]|uniref:Uncharacterized protein n=1 Tax=Rhamnella rubrinervis TaxID=2594499 RepID=A0A8K0E0M5_9ROSA|nr:hypothetical protein FNV43_RR20892 [Rhamnella rubrinervis]